MIHVDPARVASSPVPADDRSPARALAERQLAMLTRLAEVGMEIVEAAGRQAAAAPAEADGASALHEAGLTYARVARAVRMTLALQCQLLKDLSALETAQGEAKAERASRRRAGLYRMVNRALEAEHLDRREVFHLSMLASERLKDAEVDAELAGLTFAEAVARICEDLGLSPEVAAPIVAAAGASPSGDPPCGAAPSGPEPWPARNAAAVGDDARPSAPPSG